MEIQELPVALDPPAGQPIYFATVIAGLESIASDELIERIPLATPLALLRGKVLFASPDQAGAGLDLLTIEDLLAFVGQIGGIPASASGLGVIERRMAAIDLEPALAIHHELHGRPAAQRFRITASRDGSHDYNSLQIAAAAGKGVEERYGWGVDLEDYDYDVRVYVTDDAALVGLRLSPESLHRRARVRHGPASLNPTVAHAMCRLTDPRAGEVFVDPMCGTGTLLIERARFAHGALLIGGDLFDEPLDAARENLRAADTAAALVRWDARRLPLQDACVDEIACNMPWGRRVGSHRVNRHLYPGFMREVARVLRPGALAAQRSTYCDAPGTEAKRRAESRRPAASRRGPPPLQEAPVTR